MSAAVEIRAERPEDVAAIGDVLRSTFPTVDEADLVGHLRLSGRLLTSLVAASIGQLVGHVAFSPVTIADRVGAGLAPLAVMADYRRRGIGASLVEEGLIACERAGVPFVVVLGKAAYYSRFGFRPASGYDVTDEFGGGDNFAIIELAPEGIPAGGGLARYASEFDVFKQSTAAV